MYDRVMRMRKKNTEMKRMNEIRPHWQVATTTNKNIDINIVIKIHIFSRISIFAVFLNVIGHRKAHIRILKTDKMQPRIENRKLKKVETTTF